MQLLKQNLSGISLIVVAAMTSACSSFLNMEDDTPPPPSPREIRQLSIPRDLAGNRPERSPLTPEVLNAQRQIAPAVPVATMAPTVAVPEAPKESEPKINKMLFAPYIPSVKEGTVPNKWQKQPVYDFPWIAGAEPTRVNEETVVGAGEKMLGRLYAKVSYDHKPEAAKPVEAEVAKPVEPPPSAKDNKKNKKSKVSDAELNAYIPLEVKKEKNISKKVICESVTCLDAARDSLVEDAQVKGWEMLLNRRVSMHQSFQFARNGRVIWIEVNLTNPKELYIEYSLMPLQNSQSKN
jgi:hypothetical protein